MFGNIGGFEMIVLAIIGLLVFGPRRLPEIGRTLGKAMVEFRRAALELRTSIEREVNLDEVRETTRTIQKAMTGDLLPGTREILPSLKKEAASIVEQAGETAAPPPSPAPESEGGGDPTPAGTDVSGTEARGTTDAARRD